MFLLAAGLLGQLDLVGIEIAEVVLGANDDLLPTILTGDEDRQQVTVVPTEQSVTLHLALSNGGIYDVISDEPFGPDRENP